jgi:MOSC domain-containing protein YiiM
MVKEDSPVTRVDYNGAYLSGNDDKASMSRQRLNEYRALLKKLKVKSINRFGQNFTFEVWTENLVCIEPKFSFG